MSAEEIGTGENELKVNSTVISESICFHRVVNVWNSLPDHVVESMTPEILKSRFDTMLDTLSARIFQIRF